MKRLVLPTKRLAAIALVTSLALGGTPTMSAAQDTASGQIAQNRADGTAAANAEAINNGTNPTLLTTQAVIQNQYTRFGNCLHSGLLELQFNQPIGDGSKALRFTLPFASSPIDSSAELGDFSVTFVDVFHLSPRNGAAYTVELFLDTASRVDNGYGQFALETSVFYAFFLNNGGIFAPAWVQTFGLEGGNATGVKLNQTTFDFYYVPKLPTRSTS